MIKRRERKVTKMLVIDRIELTAVDHVFHVRHFNDQDAILLKNEPKATHKSIKLGDVRQNIIGVNDVGSLPFVEEACRQLFVKELADRRYAALHLGNARDISSRLNSQNGNARLFVILQ